MCLLKSLIEEPRPVGERGGHHAGVYEVKFMMVSTGFFHIIDLKGDVWGNEMWLDLNWISSQSQGMSRSMDIGYVIGYRMGTK